jgi:hypothetical protein
MLNAPSAGTMRTNWRRFKIIRAFGAQRSG